MAKCAHPQQSWSAGNRSEFADGCQRQRPSAYPMIAGAGCVVSRARRPPSASPGVRAGGGSGIGQAVGRGQYAICLLVVGTGFGEV
jgi:hypothetical protein